MKKLILLILLLPSLCFGGSIQDAHKAVIARMNTAVVCDDCSGTLKFSWHMEDNDSTPDVTIGNPCGCSNNDTIGAISDAPVFSTTQKSDGTYSLHINALDENYLFSVTTDDIVEVDNLKITFDIYVVSYPSAGKYHHIIFAGDDVNNYLQIQLEGTNTVLGVYYNGQTTVDRINVNLDTGSWVSCEYQAKTGVAGNDHYLACGVASTEEDDDLVAFAATADSIRFGDEYGDEAGEYYLDNVKIYPSDY